MNVSERNTGPLPDHEASERRLATERVIAGEQRMRALEDFHRLVDAVTDYAIFRLDAAGRVATWNAGARKTKGYEESEVLGRHFSIFYPPQDQAAGRPEQILATVRREGRFEEEGWRVRKDGSRFWASVVITALRGADGAVTGFAKVTRDLSERRAAAENEQRLVREQLARAISEEERQRLLGVLQQVPAMINFLRGPDLVIEVAHPKLREAAGGREILGLPLLAAFPDLRDSPLHARLLAVYESGVPSEAHEQPPWFGGATDYGDSYWNSVYLPICDASSKVVGVVTFDLDVTEGVRVRRELERADRAKDSFLATMSHELRTPLNALMGWVQILQKDGADPKRLAHGLEVIERNARAQQRIVNDLLDVSRIATGKLQLSLRPTDVGAVVRAAADVIRPAAEAKGVRLVVEAAQGIGRETLADPDRLQQMVWNLLSNAVRYTPQDGQVRVEVTRSGSSLRIVVADTGAGIPPAHLPHIFERFHQIDGVASRRAGGLGLGLAIVRHLTEAHGGTVSVSSPGEGRGTTFTIELPMRTVDAPEDRPEGPLLAGFQVWLVDDDADSLELVAASLRGVGAVVTSFSSATEALEARGECDVLVSDIGLPDMDGYKLLQALRARDDVAAFPAVALTGFDGPLDTQRAVLAGFQHYLTKPIHPSSLIDAVRQWCHHE